MIRKIIKIDSEKCTGCGACVSACHEGAIKMNDGKAFLALEHHCDGLGDCLPACPSGAISFEEREAPAYDEESVKRSKNASGCPGSRSISFGRGSSDAVVDGSCMSELSNWPVQIKLASPNAVYFNGADLLIAADCSAYAFGGFHSRFVKGRIVLIGCPKLDAVDYSEKLSAIFEANEIKSITVARMTVPCCSGIENAVKNALLASAKWIPLTVAVISSDGKIVSEIEY